MENLTGNGTPFMTVLCKLHLCVTIVLMLLANFCRLAALLGVPLRYAHSLTDIRLGCKNM